MVQKIDEITEHVNQASVFIPSLLHELEQVMVGQKYLTERLILGLLTGEHVLVEGVPGLAKTTAVKTLAQSVKADFKRIQFTPDLLPADLLGTQIYQPKLGSLILKKGLFSRTSFLRMKSIGLLPKFKVRCLKPCRKDRSPLLGQPSNSKSPSW